MRALEEAEVEEYGETVAEMEEEEYEAWAALALYDRLAAHGFEVMGTGGNCKALVRLEALPGYEEYITDGDAALPGDDDAEVWITTETEADGVINEAKAFTLLEAAAALENAAAVPVLLAERLAAGLHLKRNGGAL